MITSAFFGKMAQASLSQKRVKFAPFPGCLPTAKEAGLSIIAIEKKTKNRQVSGFRAASEDFGIS